MLLFSWVSPNACGTHNVCSSKIARNVQALTCGCKLHIPSLKLTLLLLQGPMRNLDFVPTTNQSCCNYRGPPTTQHQPGIQGAGKVSQAAMRWKSTPLRRKVSVLEFGFICVCIFCCVCACVFVCTCVCIYVHVCVCLYLYVCVRSYLCLRVCLCSSFYVYATVSFFADCSFLFLSVCTITCLHLWSRRATAAAGGDLAPVIGQVTPSCSAPPLSPLLPTFSTQHTNSTYLGSI